MSEVDDDAVLSDVEGQDETQQDGYIFLRYQEYGQVYIFDIFLLSAPQVQVCHLTQETISQGLSLLCRTGNGLGHAFVKLDLKDKGLNDIAAISSYIHIRFLDVSNNQLTDLSPLASLTQLLWLKGQPFAQLTYLQWLSMAVNRLTDLDGLVGPALETLNLTGNSIKRVTGLQSGCFANLVCLELRGNHLDTTDGINLPNLRRLYLVIKLL
uniref:Leucine-rich repeat-containing protein 23 n=1 Tax=Lates calcarifer TaxID=8187 RepID=A0A4W6ERF4_LATCA